LDKALCKLDAAHQGHHNVGQQQIYGPLALFN
jgi:hypothetical protein